MLQDKNGEIWLHRAVWYHIQKAVRYVMKSCNANDKLNMLYAASKHGETPLDLLSSIVYVINECNRSKLAQQNLRYLLGVISHINEDEMLKFADQIFKSVCCAKDTISHNIVHFSGLQVWIHKNKLHTANQTQPADGEQHNNGISEYRQSMMRVILDHLSPHHQLLLIGESEDLEAQLATAEEDSLEREITLLQQFRTKSKISIAMSLEKRGMYEVL